MAEPTFDLTGVDRVTLTGQPVTFERGGDQLIVADGWIVTWWEQGLPVARKPVPEAEVLRLLALYPHTFRP